MTAEYWGDPVPSHYPKGSFVRIGTQHEGIRVSFGVPSRRGVLLAEAYYGPEEARRIASNLEKAANQWEED